MSTDYIIKKGKYFNYKYQVYLKTKKNIYVPLKILDKKYNMLSFYMNATYRSPKVGMPLRIIIIILKLIIKK